MQYFAPSLQFLCGVAIFHEEMSRGRWAGFAIIWASLAVFVAESLIVARRAGQTATT